MADAPRHRLICITPEHFFDSEASVITAILADGTIDRIHIRKPGADHESVARLIENIPAQYHHRLTVHRLRDIASRFGTGLHIPSDTSLTELATLSRQGYISLSASCHTFEELQANASFTDYRFISPVFDSISKKGYQSAFDRHALGYAAKSGIIDNNVVALGGINSDNIMLLNEYGFGGAALSGYLWSNIDMHEILNRIHRLKCFLTS